MDFVHPQHHFVDPLKEMKPFTGMWACLVVGAFVWGVYGKRMGKPPLFIIFPCGGGGRKLIR